MKRLKQVIKRWFSLKNLVSLLIIFGALVIGLGIGPFDSGNGFQNAVLILLVFLSLDAILERFGLLADIDDKLKSVLDQVSYRTTADGFFKQRAEFPRMEVILKEAKEEVWVSGISFGTMTIIAPTFSELMQKGLKVRFLGINPEGSCFPLLAEYFHWVNLEETMRGIHLNYSKLNNLPTGKRKDALQFRVVDQVMTTGYFIIDPKSSRARMMVQLYHHHIDSEKSPVFVIEKEDDPRWFSEYMDQFISFWDTATPFTQIKQAK